MNDLAASPAEPVTADDPLLWPAPRQVTLHDGTLELPAFGLLVLAAGEATLELADPARAVQAALREYAGVDWPLLAGSAPAGSAPGGGAAFALTLSLVPGATPHAQGYLLQVTSERIDAVASTPAGLFYAMQTLCQLARCYGGSWPLLQIVDWPDFAVRGVMLDISRDRVPSFERLLQTVELLAQLKVNQLQLYTEHTFAYRAHGEVWAHASPLTGDEVLALDAFCRARRIELVPNQNTFGHMRRWLTLPRYRELAEAPNGCDTRWGRFDEPFSLNPGDPRSIELVAGLLDELLPHFSSTQVNVGLDETVDLGEGASRAAVQERGVGPVFLDFVRKVLGEVKRRDHTAQMWGDILMEHPELTAQLPRDLIALEWGYEADHPFDEHGARYAAAGLPFYLCPGTASWNSIAGRTQNMVENVRSAARNGLKHGAAGLLMTDWGDNGHWQPPAVSLLPLSFAAGAAWHCAASCAPDAEERLAAAANLHLLQDEGGVAAQAALALGRLETLLPGRVHNSHALFQLLQPHAGGPGDAVLDAAPADEWRHALAAVRVEIDTQLALLEAAAPQAPIAAHWVRELTWAASLLEHGAERGLWLLDGKPAARADALAADVQALVDEYAALWALSSRPGGFADSVARLRALVASYTAESSAAPAA